MSLPLAGILVVELGHSVAAPCAGLVLGDLGAKGPLSQRPGYDPLMQAFGGIMSVVGEEGRPPVRVAPSIIDQGTAMWGVVGILSALYHRRDTGKRSVVDVSLFETAAAWMVMQAAQYLGSGEIPTRHGSGAAGIVPYRAYRTKDGDLVVAAGNDSLFRKFCSVLARNEWATDEKYRSNPDRVKNAQALYTMIEIEMAKRSNAEWTAQLDAAGVPCAPVQNVAQMLECDQMKALGLLQDVPGSSKPLIGLPISFDGRRPLPRSASPALGAHTAEVLDQTKFGDARRDPR